jgi:PAS domain S-box-containing protein
MSTGAKILAAFTLAAAASANRTLWALGLWMPLALLLLAVAAVVLMRKVRLEGPVAPPAAAGGKWAGTALRYSSAVLAVAVAALVKARLEASVGDLPLFITFYPAVLLVATLAGGGPGIVTAILSALAADYWFVKPYGSFMIESASDALAVGIFTAANLFLCILAERLRRARWAEAVSAAQRQQLEELSRLNEELTQQSEELAQQSEELSQQNEELQTQSEEIQTLNTELTQREGMLQKLLDAARQARVEHAVLRDIGAAAMEIFGLAASAVIVYEKQGEQLVLRSQAGLGPDDAGIESLPVEHTFCDLVIAENKTACLADTSLRPDLSILEIPGAPPFRSVLAAPMRAGEHPFGVVAVYSRQKQEWTAEQFRLAEWLAAQCGRILETLRLQEQTRRQAALIDLSPDAIIVKRTDDTITFWSRGAETLYGWTKQEALGQRSDTLLQTQFPQPLEQIIEQLKGTGRWSGEIVHRGKDGRAVVVQSWWLTQLDAHGEVAEIMESNVDVSERVRAREALRTSRDRLNMLVETATQVVAKSELAAMLDGIAHAARELTGARLATAGHGYINKRFQVGGASRDEQTPPCPPGQEFQVDRGGVYMDLIEGQASMRLTDQQMRSRPDWWGLPADHVPMRGMLGARLVDAAGRSNGLIMVSDKAGGEFSEEDEVLLRQLATLSSLSLQHVGVRTEAERRAAEAERAAVELARSNKELEEFAYVASHDLQEPLRVISGYIQLIERRYKDKLDADANEFIDYTTEATRRLQQLISDLLEYSRVGMRGKPLQPTRAQAPLLVAIGSLEHAIAESGARVTHDPLPEVLADELQLAQVFQNLIGNAIKFRGEAPPEVHIRAERDGPQWRLAVRDNGIGIESSYWNRIFLIFQRLHPRQQYSGTGIGLAICKRIVERHGGRIWVESQSGAGSTFFFTLAAAPD